MSNAPTILLLLNAAQGARSSSGHQKRLAQACSVELGNDQGVPRHVFEDRSPKF
jgi:hypothetical protein